MVQLDTNRIKLEQFYIADIPGHLVMGTKSL